MQAVRLKLLARIIKYFIGRDVISHNQCYDKMNYYIQCDNSGRPAMRMRNQCRERMHTGSEIRMHGLAHPLAALLLNEAPNKDLKI